MALLASNTHRSSGEQAMALLASTTQSFLKRYKKKAQLRGAIEKHSTTSVHKKLVR
jgi:hypothetical protein